MKNRFYVLILSLSFMVGATACSDSSESGSANSATYTGPGSFYSVSMAEDNTFSLAIADAFGEDNEIEVSGSFESFDTGFVKFTIEEVTASPEEGPEVGDEAYGLLVDGFALFLKPIGSSEIIPMVIAGDCPSEDFTANWFIAQAGELSDKDFSLNTQEAFGTFNYNHAALSAEVSEHFNLVDFSEMSEPNAVESLECENGFMQIVDDSNAINMWLTSNGGAIVEATNDGQRDSSIVALPQQTLTSIASLEGDYAALIFSDGGEDGDSVLPASIAIDDAGESTVEILDNVETGELANESAEVNLSGTLNSPADGFVTGSLAIGSDTGHIACTAALGLGGDAKDVIACMGQEPSDNSKPFMVIMVEK